MKTVTTVCLVIAGGFILLGYSLNCHAEPTGFHVYFNDAPHSNSNGIDDHLVAFIGSADSTVEAAFYSIGRVKIVDALINKSQEIGVENVRIITDYDNRNSTGCIRLVNAGLTVIDESFDDEITENEAGYIECHNKFCIVDGEKVWTGSYNITDSGTIYNNNNAVAIECPELAQEYLIEFNEMWGAPSGPPGDCHFSTQKNPHTKHLFTCNGVPLELYFSPTKESYPNRAMDVIQLEIQDSLSSLYFCLFSFTSNPISDKIVKAHDDGIAVQGVMDNVQAGYAGSEYLPLVNAGVDVILDDTVDPHANFLHHKFAVIDRGSANARVITGSYNWSESAQFSNDENSLVIRNQEIAERYYEEFYRCYYGVDPGPQVPSISIQCNQSVYSGGSYMRVWTQIKNPGMNRTLDEWIILDLGEAYGTDRFYFWPTWTTSPDYQRMYLSTDETFEQEIFSFVLPYPLPPCGPFIIYAGFLNPSTMQLEGNYDYCQFSFE